MQSFTVGAAGLFNLLVLLSLVISYIFLLPYFRSPLRRVPNAHWSSSLSPIWILWIRYQGRELAVLEEAHRQLGPIVRTGPADLSISCYEDGIRTIYNGGFEKPQYFNFFAYFERKNAFCSLTRQDHTLRRKRITPAYTKTALFASESLSSLTQTILLDRFLPDLQRQVSSSQPVEILSLSYALCLDLITCFQFGLSSGSNFLQDRNSLTSWLHHYEQRYCKEAFWPQELPNLTRCLKFIGINMLPKSQPLSTQVLEDWLLGLCDRAESVRLDVAKGSSVHVSDIPVVYDLVKKGVDADLPNAELDERRDEIASELFDQMCGREVLGLVLAYTIYYISQNPAAQARLQAELATLEPGLHNAGRTTSDDMKHDGIDSGLRLPSPSSLDKLPYLSAIIQESLRMRPNSTPLPRVTPRDRPVTLAGVPNIPGGVRVNAFQWFIHRNPDNFDRVNEWHPERWLETDSKDGKKPLLWAFGGGGRMCVGVSLTQYLMRYILAILYSNFSSRVVSKAYGVHEPGSPEDSIVVQFEPISKVQS